MVVTGHALDYLVKLRNSRKDIGAYSSEQVLEFILSNTKVYTKMLPEHKTILINELKSDRIVGVWGDGLNDCGALRVADVSIAIGNSNEGSLVSTFISKSDNLGSVSNIVLQGRAFAELSFDLFKLLMIYLSVKVVIFGVLYQSLFDLNDSIIIYCDIIWIMLWSIMIWSAPAKTKLFKSNPTASLISLPVFVNIIGQIIIQLSCIFGVYRMLQAKRFDLQNHHSLKNHIHDYETTTLFLFSLPQYLFLSLALYVSAKFRRPRFGIKTATLLIFSISVTYWNIVFPIPWIAQWLKAKDIKISIRLMLSWCTLLNGLLTLGYELSFSN